MPPSRNFLELRITCAKRPQKFWEGVRGNLFFQKGFPGSFSLYLLNFFISSMNRPNK